MFHALYIYICLNFAICVLKYLLFTAKRKTKRGSRKKKPMSGINTEIHLGTKNKFKTTRNKPSQLLNHWNCKHKSCDVDSFIEQDLLDFDKYNITNSIYKIRSVERWNEGQKYAPLKSANYVAFANNGDRSYTILDSAEASFCFNSQCS